MIRLPLGIASNVNKPNPVALRLTTNLRFPLFMAAILKHLCSVALARVITSLLQIWNTTERDFINTPKLNSQRRARRLLPSSFSQMENPTSQLL
jgi:hypothetical protein